MVVGDFAIELETVVIGAGPGGYVAAIRAAQMGQKVAIIEREYIGGVCLNVGCIPSKALINAGHRFQEAQHSEVFGITAKNVELDFSKTQAWKNNHVVKKLTNGIEYLLKKNKVDIIRGEAFFVDQNTLRVVNEDSAQTYQFNNAIVATGSHPIEIPGFKFGERVIDSTGGLNLKEVPKKLVIIGGGVIGCELGAAYANLGSEVVILEGSDYILPNFERDMAQLVVNNFDSKGTKIVTNAMAKEAIDNGDSVTVKYEVEGKEQSVTADYVMVNVGRKPNTEDLGLDVIGVEMNDRGLVLVDEQRKTNIKNIYAIGDIVPGPALAHKASYEAKIAAEAIAGKNVAVDYRSIPAVAFTDPELATVGLTVAEAKEKGIDVVASKFSLASNGRALSLNQTEGFVRLVTTKEDKVIVGAQVAGVNASDVIAELGLAVETGMNAEDISLTIHSHPSLTEAVMDTAELALGLPIHQ